MAKKRMFSLQIVDTDAFLDMPLSTQALYFHLSMRADDDGFVDNYKKIMKVIGAQDDDLKILFTKRFILGFESGIIVIKHWRINNYIQKDRYTKTVYLEEKKLILAKENNSYTECIRNGDTGKVRLGKVRLDKVRSDKASIAGKPAEVIPDLLKDKQRHIHIIGIFAKAKKTVFTSKEQQGSFIRRNLRAAKNLIGYEDDRIIETLKYLILYEDFKITLDTVGKYIDEDLNKLAIKNTKTIKI